MDATRTAANLQTGKDPAGRATYLFTSESVGEGHPGIITGHQHPAPYFTLTNNLYWCLIFAINQINIVLGAVYRILSTSVAAFWV